MPGDAPKYPRPPPVELPREPGEARTGDQAVFTPGSILLLVHWRRRGCGHANGIERLQSWGMRVGGSLLEAQCSPEPKSNICI